MQLLVGTLLFALLLSLPLVSGAADRCHDREGGFVVINVSWDDPIGGLAVRKQPQSSSERLKVLASDEIGISVRECTSSGWCRVGDLCQDYGWSYAAKYLAPRSRRLNAVTGVSPSDPEGLNIRSGPHQSYPKAGAIPYNGREVVKHHCQPSPQSGREWCLVTYGISQPQSGWVAGRYLTPMISSVPVAPPPPIDPKPPSQEQPPGGDDPASKKACQLFPNLC
jgi:hypothetical protein